MSGLFPKIVFIIFQGKHVESYLRALSVYFEIHSNIVNHQSDDFFGFVHNHNVAYGEAYQHLLKSASVSPAAIIDLINLKHVNIAAASCWLTSALFVM